MKDFSQLRKSYAPRKHEIEKRLAEFKNPKTDEELFAELCFCLLTPQSRAKTCWAAVEKLRKDKMLLSGNEIKSKLTGVRFANNKSNYIDRARKIDMNEIKKIKDAKELRLWLVKNVKGIGYKEASHFLRNTGQGEDLAILDRHILKNLKKYGVIKEIPKTLTPKKYLEIEKRMEQFSEKINIPLSHLDLLFWSEETGEVFK